MSSIIMSRIKLEGPPEFGRDSGEVSGDWVSKDTFLGSPSTALINIPVQFTKDAGQDHLGLVT